MSLGIYKVDWQPLHYPEPIGEADIDFLHGLQSDDGTYYIESQLLGERIEDCREMGIEVPERLVAFLREELKKEDGFSIALF